jgi:hypothetical protein
MQKLWNLKNKICPRPWVIVGPDKNGHYKMNYGRDDTIVSRSYDTLEFIRLAVEFTDDLEVKRQPEKVDSIETPAQS